MSPSKESKRSQSVDGQDEAEMFQEKATYTTHRMDGDDGANGDNTHAKATVALVASILSPSC